LGVFTWKEYFGCYLNYISWKISLHTSCILIFLNIGKAMGTLGSFKMVSLVRLILDCASVISFHSFLYTNSRFRVIRNKPFLYLTIYKTYYLLQSNLLKAKSYLNELIRYFDLHSCIFSIKREIHTSFSKYASLYL